MTFVKICGLTNFVDAEVAVEAGADFVGFIFYEGSPRKVDPGIVARIMQAFDDPAAPTGVGVFVSPACEEVKRTLTGCGLKAAQVNRLSRDELRAVQAATYGTAYAAIQPRTADEALTALDLVNEDASVGTSQPAALRFRTPWWCPQLLIDGYHPGQPGGTGQRADLDIARRLIARVPRLVLAGGLTPDNVGEVIRAVRPWAVDVASGTESAPGKKDHGKVRAFIQAVRDADKDLTR